MGQASDVKLWGHRQHVKKKLAGLPLPDLAVRYKPIRAKRYPLVS
jgi:hypothetical protein